MLDVYLRILLPSPSNPCSADNGGGGKSWVSLKSGVTRSSVPDYANKSRTKGPPRCTPNQTPHRARRDSAAASLCETQGRGELRPVGWGRARALGAHWGSAAPGAARPASRRRGAGEASGARPVGVSGGRGQRGRRRRGAAARPPPGAVCAYRLRCLQPSCRRRRAHGHAGTRADTARAAELPASPGVAVLHGVPRSALRCPRIPRRADGEQWEDAPEPRLLRLLPAVRAV